MQKGKKVTTTMKESLLPPIDHEAFGEENDHEKNVNIHATDSCCHDRCSCRTCCYEKLSCCQINSKRDTTLCCLLSGALICIFAAIIVPTIINILLEK